MVDYQQTFLSLYGNPVRREGNTQLIFVCPECTHKSLSCSLVEGLFRCFHCNLSGRLKEGRSNILPPDPVDEQLQLEIGKILWKTLPLEKWDAQQLLKRGLLNDWGVVSTQFRLERYLGAYNEQQLINSGWFYYTDKGLKPGTSLEYGNLLIPYWSGEELVGFRSRVSHLYESEGRARYSSPRGFKLANWLWWRPNKFNHQDLIITEGEIKAMVCIDWGFWAASIPGINNYQQLLPQIRALSLGVNRVFVILDSGPDMKNDKGLLSAAKALARAAGSKGVCMFLPQEFPDQKVGVDDFLLSSGPEELEWWMETAWANKDNYGRPFFCTYSA